MSEQMSETFSFESFQEERAKQIEKLYQDKERIVAIADLMETSGWSAGCLSKNRGTTEVLSASSKEHGRAAQEHVKALSRSDHSSLSVPCYAACMVPAAFQARHEGQQPRTR